MLAVSAVAYALGDVSESVRSWCSTNGQSAGLLEGLLCSGANTLRRAVALGQVDLASLATAKLIANAQVNPSAVNVLIICHTSPSNTLPAPLTLAGEIKRRLRLDRALGFAIGQQQCVSPIHALRATHLMFERDPRLGVAILLCADTLASEALRPIGRAGIQSDGASAMLLRRGSGSRVSAIYTYNHARPTEGIRPDGSYESDPHYLWALVSVMRQVARTAELGLGDFTTVLPHNVNLPAWQQALDALRLPRARLFDRNFARIGHVFGSDIAINLSDSGALTTPGHHLVVTSGIGGTFGGFVVTTS